MRNGHFVNYPFPLSLTSSLESRHPILKWTQTKEKITITVELRDIKNEKVDFSNGTHFSFSGDSDNKQYAQELELFGEVVPSESSYKKLDLHIVVTLVKKEKGPFWKRLHKDLNKYNNIQVDWNNFEDSDEEEGDGEMPGMGGMGGMDMASMMQGMGGMGGMPGMDMGGEEDSDDEPAANLGKIDAICLE